MLLQIIAYRRVDRRSIDEDHSLFYNSIHGSWDLTNSLYDPFISFTSQLKLFSHGVQGYAFDFHPAVPGARRVQVRLFMLNNDATLLLNRFVKYSRAGKRIAVDGQHLSIVAIVAAARHLASVSLIDSPDIVNRMARSREVIAHSVDGKKSVYGVSTGFGGSGESQSTHTWQTQILTSRFGSGHSDEQLRRSRSSVIARSSFWRTVYFGLYDDSPPSS